MINNLSGKIVYLSGPIDKKNGLLNTFMAEIESVLTNAGAAVLTPEIRPEDVHNPYAVYCRDVSQCLLADIIIVDARDSCGLGVGAEVVFAKSTGASIHFIAPNKSHYVREEVNILGQSVRDWVHPFLVGLSSGNHLIDSSDASEICERIGKSFAIRIFDSSKIPPDFIKIVGDYFDKFYQNDEPMIELFRKHDRMKEISNLLLGS